MRCPDILVAKTTGALKPAPINAEWIVSGQPTARAALLSHSQDRTALTVVWDCTAGEFNWFYDTEEIIHVLEGSATLHFNGIVEKISTGSVVVFPAGSQARWVVDGYIRKLAVFRQVVPTPFSVTMRGWSKLRSMLQPGQMQGQPAMA